MTPDYAQVEQDRGDAELERVDILRQQVATMRMVHAWVIENCHPSMQDHVRIAASVLEVEARKLLPAPARPVVRHLMAVERDPRRNPMADG